MSDKPNLDGPKAKLARALEHQREYEAVLDEYISQRPLGIRARPSGDGWTDLILVIRVPIPVRLGTIFADLVNNLESALDQLVAQLVLGSGNDISTGNYYPVVMKADRWPVVRPDKLKGVKDEWADVIRDAQPFVDEPNAERHPLAVLHAANKVNKHTLLKPTVISDAEWQPTFRLNRAAREGDQLVSDLPHLDRPLGHGDVLVRVKATSAEGDLEVVGLEPGRDIPMDVGFGFEGLLPNRGSANEKLPDVIGYVIGVIDKIEEVLST